MVRITESLLARRAEHNDGMLLSLQEIGLHNQGIERIEVINHLCRHLRILHLQNNIICKIEQLNRLKELEDLNLALNNISRVQNLQRCESLRRLDLTANFVDRAGLLSLRSLQDNEQLEELCLTGNPCCQWHGYRPFVLGTLPHLHSLDGSPVRPSERIAAARQLPELEARLRAELIAEGVDPDEAAQVQDDSLLDADEIPETGTLDAQGRLLRPWCAATRVLDRREAEAREEARRAAERASRERCAGLFGEPELEPPPRTGFPEVVEGRPLYQKNEGEGLKVVAHWWQLQLTRVEGIRLPVAVVQWCRLDGLGTLRTDPAAGKWEYRLEESGDGLSLRLDVAFDRLLDSSAIQADVQPGYVRLLARGRLLQLRLPAEVAPDAAVAQRSRVTGHLLVNMPLASSSAWQAGAAKLGGPSRGCAADKVGSSGPWEGRATGEGRIGRAAELAAELPPALLSTAGSPRGGQGPCDDDDLPPL